MSLPIISRPIARLELDEAMGWYQKQKEGLEAEFKDAVDQMVERIAAAPLGLARFAAKFAVLYCDGFLRRQCGKDWRLHRKHEQPTNAVATLRPERGNLGAKHDPSSDQILKPLRRKIEKKR